MVAALTDTPLAPQGVQPKPTAQTDQDGTSRGLFGKDGFSFWDLLDIVNPLQHIPVVSTIYRAVTGDKIDPGARIAGGTLFGGPIGMAVSLVSAMVEEGTGKDPGEHALAMLGIGDEPAAEQAVAAQPPQPDRVPPELLAALHPPPRSDLKLSVKPAFSDGAAENASSPRRAAHNASPQSNVAPQAAMPQAAMPQAAMPQAAMPLASDEAALAAIAARARGPQPGARSTAAPPAPPQIIDGRTWFPAFPQGGGGAPVRGVGAQPVSSQNAVAKFGVARGASDQGAAFRPGSQSQAEWAERAAAAYRKYSTMQQQRDRQRAVDASY